MIDTRVLFWIIMAFTVGALLLDAALRRKRRKRPVVMMARPMTKYEREQRR